MLGFVIKFLNKKGKMEGKKEKKKISILEEKRAKGQNETQQGVTVSRGG